MSFICYQKRNFAPASLSTINQANEIIDEYLEMGFSLTLRQLYYQFVARGLIENSQRSYKRLGSLINDARLAGLVSWSAIEDRTRNLQSRASWDGPAELLRCAADGYGRDLWEGQDLRVEVWVEKDALIGVLESACTDNDVPFFSCRGYVSQSEMWNAAMRHRGYGVPVEVLHLGDHDPSGIDMTRDIQDRLHLFGADTFVRRIALNMLQVEEYNPPPNPAKVTDARFDGYFIEYGSESWELDALRPDVLDALIRTHIEELRTARLWNAAVERQEAERKEVSELADSHSWGGGPA